MTHTQVFERKKNVIVFLGLEVTVKDGKNRSPRWKTIKLQKLVK